MSALMVLENVNRVIGILFCRMDRALSFSRGKNTSTALVPKRRTSRNTATRPRKAPNRLSI